MTVILTAVLALGLGSTGCGDDDDSDDAGVSAPPPTSSSRNALEQQALETFCTALKRQTDLDLDTVAGAGAAVAFFDELLQSAPSDVVDAVQLLRDSFSRIATAPSPEQIPQLKNEILQPVTAAFTTVGGFQQSQCKGF